MAKIIKLSKIFAQDINLRIDKSTSNNERVNSQKKGQLTMVNRDVKK